MNFDNKNDPFKEGPSYSIHIRIQQRNGRKSWTTVEGIPEDLDKKKILKYLRKCFSTNGTVITDNDGREIIILQGDQRNNVYTSFINWNISEKQHLHIHGA